MDASPDSDGFDGTRCVVIGPNASMGPGQAAAAFAVLACVSLTIAGAFAWQGFWPILPFAGLELAALAAALHVSLRRNRYREVVRVTDDLVVVEVGMAGGGARVRTEFGRHASRVLLEPGVTATAPTRLVLSCHGQRAEIGGCLTEIERAALAQRLKVLLHPGWVRQPDRSAPAGR